MGDLEFDFYKGWIKYRETKANLASPTNYIIQPKTIKGTTYYHVIDASNGRIELETTNPSTAIQYATNALSNGTIFVKGINPYDVTYTKKAGVQVVFDYYGLLHWGWLQQYKIVYVPTNAGWTASVSGSGATIQKPVYLTARTGTTANSNAKLHTYAAGLSVGESAHSVVDFSKRTEMHFYIQRNSSDSEVVGHVQVKRSNAVGDLAEEGIGLRIENFNVIGEAYGTARNTVSLVTLTNYRPARFTIVLVPNTRVEFWVNGELKGTLTGSAVPTGKTGDTYIVVDIANGATGGVDARLIMGNLIFIQEW